MSDSEHFDAKARQWDEHPGKRRIAELFAAELSKQVPLRSSMECLEFGCGTGLVSMELYRHVAWITLLDTSPGMIEVLTEKIARQGIANMTPRQGELASEQFMNKRFDLIYSNMALHHVADPRRTLETFARLLRPGGFLCIGDLEPEDGSFHQSETAVQHGFDCQELAAILINCGLTVDQCYRSHVMQKTDASGQVRDYPLFFLKARRTDA